MTKQIEIDTNEEITEQKRKNLPEMKYRAGGVSATVWKNIVKRDKEQHEFKTVSFERTYKDSDGNWQSTSSLRTNDLPKAIVVLNKAYEYIVLTGNG